MAFYVSDGSSTEKKIGAGIVRSEGISKSYYAFTATTKSHQSVGAECFAIHKAAELMKHYQDRKVTLVTDFQHMIDLYEGIRIPVRPVPPWVIRALNDLKQLRAGGVDLRLKHRSELPPIMDYAASHRLSRAYKWSDPPEIEKSEAGGVPEPVAFIEAVCPHARPRERTFNENRRILQNWRLPSASPFCNTDMIEDAERFIFQQTAGSRWVVLDENKQPCFFGRTLVDVLQAVFFTLEPTGEPVRINEHAVHLLRRMPPEEQNEAYYTVVSRMAAFPLIVFADLPLISPLHGIKEICEVATFGPSRPMLG
ncbi:hypothetical protein [Alteribacter natronophilus]|uniref:hypothetical protein n=1 Tax=Alteribacter natronophilus TaxID=2583810 RepID=UPI00110D37F1|nr:hypothetical protein [Alteribacter natronophilus]TMW72900.1 hypothetical protein FGB90_00890 [Alteribacter natronophilus]